MITERPRKTGHAYEPELGSELGLEHEFESPAALERPVQAVAGVDRQATQGLDRAEAPVVYYAGTRIYFRPLELADEPLLRRWINDPRVWKYLLHRGPVSEQRDARVARSAGQERQRIRVRDRAQRQRPADRIDRPA